MHVYYKTKQKIIKYIEYVFFTYFIPYHEKIDEPRQALHMVCD